MKRKSWRLLVVAAVLGTVLFVACATSEATKGARYRAGAYSIEAQGHNGPVKVEVTFSPTAITGVKIVSSNDTPGVSDAAVEQMPGRILAAQSSEVDSVSGATDTSAAIKDAVEQAIVQASISAAAVKAANTAPTSSDLKSEYDCDIVVIGAGGAGLAATVAGVEAGYKVVLLEKQGFAGGGFNYVEGTFGIDSPIQKAAGIKLSTEKIFDESMDFNHWLGNAPLIKAFYQKSGDSIQWLMDHGVKFRGVITANPPDGNVAWHLFDGGQSGRLAVKALTDAITSKPNGTILYETPGKSLILKGGKVVGVEALRKSGQKVTIHAKAVILASGGFSSNEEMKKKYLRFPGYVNVGAGGREGDGVKMLQQVDAQFVSMNAVLGAGLVMPIPISEQMGPGTKYPGILGVIYNEGLLTLSKQGKRYMNERLPIEYRSNATEQVGGTAYVVFDQKTLDEFETKGQRFGFGAPSQLPGLQDGIDKALSERNDWMFKASSLDDLAKQTGMDVGNLKQSVANMNEYAKNGYDPEFYLEKNALYSIEQGPFYAVRVVLGMYATVGGARVTEHLQVLDSRGAVVPGLYAIGLDAGGVYGDTYDMRIANGSASSFSINSGRLAIEHIQTWLKK
jgi:fumarate reductase flavoprotein subunit